MPYFTLEGLSSVAENNPLPTIKYWLKTQKITGLKRGMYVANSYLEKLSWQGKMDNYKEYLANNLLTPSYISFEYALSLYSLLTEAPYSVTSATLKTTRGFSNNLGSYYYYSLRPDLFIGYDRFAKNGFDIYLASKAKALFDYLYIKKRSIKTINKDIIKELRLNLTELSDNDLVELKGYVKLSGQSKLLKIYALLSSLKNS